MSFSILQGLSSGIDYASLIKSMLSAQKASRLDPFASRVNELKTKNESLDEIKSLLLTLQNAASEFRSINGGAVTKSFSSSDSTIITGSASSTASSGTHEITVSQTASSATYSFSDRLTSTSDTLNSAIDNGAAIEKRTVTVVIGNGSEQETVEVELTNTSTAQNFVDEFNASSTKASASLLNVGTESSPEYKLVITGNSTGLDEGEISVTVGDEIQTAGLGSLVTASSTLSQATNAVFSIDGVSGSIERSSNQISDVLTGVTFSIQDIGTATISISPDSEATSQKIENFVDAYNEVYTYIKNNTKVSSDESGSIVFGALSQTSADDSIIESLRLAMTGLGISGREVNTFSDLGVTTQADGTLKFDSETFTAALVADPEGVTLVTESFGEAVSSVDGVLARYTRFNGLLDSSKTLYSDEIRRSEDVISRIESSLSDQEDQLIQRFSKLEAVFSRLRMQEDIIVSLLP